MIIKLPCSLDSIDAFIVIYTLHGAFAALVFFHISALHIFRQCSLMTSRCVPLFLQKNDGEDSDQGHSCPPHCTK